MYTTYGTENFSSDLFYSLNFKWTFRQNMIGIVYGTTCNISPTACSPNAKLRWLSNLLREARWQEIKMTVRIFFRTSESNAVSRKVMRKVPGNVLLLTCYPFFLGVCNYSLNNIYFIDANHFLVFSSCLRQIRLDHSLVVMYQFVTE